MNKLLIAITGFCLVGCNYVLAPVGLIVPAKISFEIDFAANPNDSSLDKSVSVRGKRKVMKPIPNTWPECSGESETGGYNRRYVYISKCVFKPKGYIPDTLVVEYAPWLTDEEMKERGLQYKSPYVLDEHGFWKKDSNGQYTPIPNIKDINAEIDRKKDASIDKIPSSQWHRIVLHPKALQAKLKHISPAGDKFVWRDKTIYYRILLNRDGSYVVEEGQRNDYAKSNSHNPWQ